jgi:hypothetical protein
MLKFLVPSGIGDISWIYSKVSDLAKKRKIGFSICDDKPVRSAPFVDLLPNITNLGYAGNTPYSRVADSSLPTNTNLSALEDGDHVLSLNQHLEQGNRLEAAFPEQPTDFHYAMNLPGDEHCKTLQAFRRDTGRRLKLGLYCSSYEHHPDLKFWTAKQWVEFVSLVRERLPSATIVVIGAPYDNKTMEVRDLLVARGDPVVSYMNQHIGETIRIISELDFLFSFPSGLGILADVVHTPCQMWFWGNLPGWERMRGLFGSYADLTHVKNGFHVTAPYEGVLKSFKLFRAKGLQIIKKLPRQ